MDRTCKRRWIHWTSKKKLFSQEIQPFCQVPLLWSSRSKTLFSTKDSLLRGSRELSMDSSFCQINHNNNKSLWSATSILIENRQTRSTIDCLDLPKSKKKMVCSKNWLQTWTTCEWSRSTKMHLVTGMTVKGIPTSTEANTKSSRSRSTVPGRTMTPRVNLRSLRNHKMISRFSWQIHSCNRQETTLENKNIRLKCMTQLLRSHLKLMIWKTI